MSYAVLLVFWNCGLPQWHCRVWGDTSVLSLNRFAVALDLDRIKCLSSSYGTVCLRLPGHFSGTALLADSFLGLSLLLSNWHRSFVLSSKLYHNFPPFPSCLMTANEECESGDNNRCELWRIIWNVFCKLNATLHTCRWWCKYYEYLPKDLCIHILFSISFLISCYLYECNMYLYHMTRRNLLPYSAMCLKVFIIYGSVISLSLLCLLIRPVQDPIHLVC